MENLELIRNLKEKKLRINKNKKIDVNKNLNEKKVLIEKLKNLVNLDNKISEKYLEFKEIQETWFKIGPVPRQDNVKIWNNFQHHIKKF